MLQLSSLDARDAELVPRALAATRLLAELATSFPDAHGASQRGW
jgi:hypothetical protein